MPTIAGMAHMDDNEIKRLIGERIAQARRDLGWSQSELARAVGMAPSTIGNYEQGTRMPRPGEATLLGKALGVSPAYLLAVDGDDMLLLDAEAEAIRWLRSLPPGEQQKMLKLLEGRAKLFAPDAPSKKRPPPKR